MPASPLRILIVDDDHDIRVCIGDLLASEGYEVVAACNGAEALKELDRTSFCLILLDLSMPVMNGWEFLEAIEHRPDRARLRVVVLSASIGASKLHVDGVLSKPASLEDLLSAVKGCRLQAAG